MVGPGYFLSRLTKKFSPQNGKKTEKRKLGCLIDENVHGQSSSSFLLLLLFCAFLGTLRLPFSFFLFSLSFLGCCLFSFLFSFFLFLISWAVGVIVVLFFYFLFFFFLTRPNFFWDILFIF